MFYIVLHAIYAWIQNLFCSSKSIDDDSLNLNHILAIDINFIFHFSMKHDLTCLKDLSLQAGPIIEN